MTIKRKIKKVGVNRRRREKRFLSREVIWGFLGSVRSCTDQRAKTKS